MRYPTRTLLQILGIGWLAFLGAGFGLRSALQGEPVVLVIDRSYCPPDQWRRVTTNYADFYAQHQKRQIQITQVVLFNDLGQEVIEPAPTPEELAELNTFGLADPTALQSVLQAFPEAQVLTCGGPN